MERHVGVHTRYDAFVLFLKLESSAHSRDGQK